MSTLTNEIQKLGKSKYVQGTYYSLKNECNIPYRSSYELAYLYQLEKNQNVLSYIYEPFDLYYTDSCRNQKIYKPDFMLLYIDGSMEIVEVKPTSMLGDFNVKAKANAARSYIKNTFKDVNMSFKFVTEKDIFSSDKEYTDFLKSLK